MPTFYEIYNDEALLERLDQGCVPRGDESLIARLKKEAGSRFKSPSLRVVDIGCGEGIHTQNLASAFPRAMVAGIEPDETILASARDLLQPELKDRVSFLPGTIEAMPFHDASTDIIWCFDMLCHVADLEAALGECRRILRPGAAMVLCSSVITPVMDPFTWQDLSPIGLVKNSMSAETIRNAAIASGFEIVEEDNRRSEFLEAIEKEDPGRVSQDFMRYARLLRASEYWEKIIGRERVVLLKALMGYNWAILTGRLDYYVWWLRS